MLGYDVKAEAPYVVFYDREKREALCNGFGTNFTMVSVRAEDMREVRIYSSESEHEVSVSHVVEAGTEGALILAYVFRFDTFEDADRFAAEVRGRVREAGLWKRG